MAPRNSYFVHFCMLTAATMISMFIYESYTINKILLPSRMFHITQKDNIFSKTYDQLMGDAEKRTSGKSELAASINDSGFSENRTRISRSAQTSTAGGVKARVNVQDGQAKLDSGHSGKANDSIQNDNSRVKTKANDHTQVKNDGVKTKARSRSKAGRPAHSKDKAKLKGKDNVVKTKDTAVAAIQANFSGEHDKDVYSIQAITSTNVQVEDSSNHTKPSSDVQAKQKKAKENQRKFKTELKNSKENPKKSQSNQRVKRRKGVGRKRDDRAMELIRIRNRKARESQERYMLTLRSSHFRSFRNLCFDPLNQPAHNESDFSGLPATDKLMFNRRKYKSGNDTISQVRLQSYDQPDHRHKSYKHILTGQPHVQSNSYWKVVVDDPANRPSEWPMIGAVAVFPSMWRSTPHLYQFLYFTYPGVFSQVWWMQQQGHIVKNKTKVILMKPGGPNSTIYDLFYSLGIDEIRDFPTVMLPKTSKPVCFTNAVFLSDVASFHDGTPERVSKSMVQSRSYIIQQLNREKCDKYYVTFIDRIATRHIINVMQLVNVTRKRGFRYVRVEYLENRTIHEQLRIIHCSSILIGVQGAALTFYSFLPHNAHMIEITFLGWNSKFKLRANRNRRDIKARVRPCTRITSEAIYRKYARRKFNHTGPVDEAMKQRLMTVNSWPVRDSDVRCLASAFKSSLPEPVLVAHDLNLEIV